MDIIHLKDYMIKPEYINIPLFFSNERTAIRNSISGYLCSNSLIRIDEDDVLIVYDKVKSGLVCGNLVAVKDTVVSMDDVDYKINAHDMILMPDYTSVPGAVMAYEPKEGVTSLFECF